MSVSGMAYATLFPAVAEQRTPGAGAATLGAITAAGGLGALTGAIYLARRSSVVGLGRVVGRAAVTFSLGLLVVAWAQPFVLLLAAAYVAGLSMMLMHAAGNTVIQTLVDDDKRGRVMSFYAFALVGTAPFGSLLTGWIAQKLGVPWALSLSAIFCAAGAAIYVLLSPRLNDLFAGATGGGASRDERASVF
jgi:MFS family permease